MASVSITELKAHFSQYLRRVLAGEVFYITNRGVESRRVPSGRPDAQDPVGDGRRPASSHWRGGKPTLPPDTLPVNTGRLVSDIVLEDRGPQWPDPDDQTD